MTKIRLLALPVLRHGGAAQFAYVPIATPALDTASTSKYAKKLEDLKQEGFEAYESWGRLPEKSWKNKLVKVFERARSQLDPHEIFAASVSDVVNHKAKHAPNWQVELVYPSKVVPSEAEMRSIFSEMLGITHASVSKNMILYTVAAPVTAIAAVLPGPNVFFAANALRLYSLWQSRRSLDQLQACEMTLVPSDCPHLNWAAESKINEGVVQVQVCSDEMAEHALGAEEAPLPASLSPVANFRNYLSKK
jgi:hypothetical protein